MVRIGDTCRGDPAWPPNVLGGAMVTGMLPGGKELGPTEYEVLGLAR